MLSIKKKILLPILTAVAVLFAVLAIIVAPSESKKVSADTTPTLKSMGVNMGYAIAANGTAAAGNPTFADTAEGLQVNFNATSNKFVLYVGDLSAEATAAKTFEFFIKSSDISSIDIRQSNATGGTNASITLDLSKAGANYDLLEMPDGRKRIRIPVKWLYHASYKYICFRNSNTAGTFTLSEMKVVDDNYAVTANAARTQGSPTFADTAAGLQVTYAATNNRMVIKVGDVTDALAAGYRLRFFVRSSGGEITSLDVRGSNPTGGSYVQQKLTLGATDGYVTNIASGIDFVDMPLSALAKDGNKANFAVGFRDINKVASFTISSLEIYNPDEYNYATTTNAAYTSNATVSASGSNGITGSYSTTAGRVYITLGRYNLVQANAAGKYLQFLITTEIDNISFRKATATNGATTSGTLDLSETNSTSGYNVYDLGSNKKLVQIAPSWYFYANNDNYTKIGLRDPNETGAYTITDMRFVSLASTVIVSGGVGSRMAENGEEVTVTKNDTPSGKYFKGWHDGTEIVDTNATYTHEVDGNVTLTATYGNVYTVTVVGGTGGGSVQDNETATVTKGATSPGKYFIGWSDGSSIVSEDEEYEFTPTGNVTLTATYGDLYTVSLTDGTISGDTSAEVVEGHSATVVADAPDTGYYFLNWTDDSDDSVVSTAASYTFTVSSDISLTANFRAYDGTAYTHGTTDNSHVPPSQKAYDEVVFDYKISSTANGDYIDFCLYEGNTFYGYFQLAENGMKETYAGITTEVQSDGYIRVTMTTADLNIVKNTTKNDSTNPAPETIKRIMIRSASGADGYIKNVHFNNYYDITVTNGTGGGTGILEGTSVTVVADSASSGQVFSCWKDGSGNVVSTNSSYTFAAAADISLTAYYGYLYTVSVTGGTISGEDSVEVIEGQSVTVVANAPDTGDYFLNWTDDSDDSVVSTAASYTFTVTGDLDLTANYRAYDGTPYTHGTNDNSHVAPDQMHYEKVIFDYKISSTANGDYIDFCLYEGNTFYGYFQLAENGMRYAYDGITTEVLSDGYIRVTMTTAYLTIVKNTTKDDSTNPAPETIKRIMIRSASGADGYIKNVHFYNYADVTVTNGTGGGSDLVIGSSVTVVADDPESGYYFACWIDDEDNIVSDDEEYTFTLIESVSLTAVYGEHVTISVENGTIGGETSATVVDNSRITLVANAASSGYYFVNWTDSGDNVVSVEKTCTIVANGTETYTANFRAYDGTLYADGKDGSIYAASAGAFSRVSFEYKVTSDSADEYFALCLLLKGSWSDYYGYFYFNDYGTEATYEGVTVTRLDDGYYRVAIDLASVTKKSGTVDPKTSAIERIYIRDANTDTDVYIRNVTFSSRTNVFEMYEGASVRLNGQYGIRFRALISYDKYDEEAKYGMIILPYDYLTKNSIDMSGDIKAQLDDKKVKYRIFSCTPVQLPSTDYYIQGSLTNILEQNLSRAFIGIAFYEKEGAYYYATLNSADYYSANKRTIKQVSERAITMNYQGFADYTAEKQDYLIGIVDSDGAAGAAFTVNAFDSLYNFKKNDDVSTSETLSLSAAKGESEFGQIVLTATSSVAGKPYVIVASDLTHTDGSTKLAKANFDLYNAWYTKADDIWARMDESDPHYSLDYSYATALPTGYFVNALVPFYAASANAESVFDRTNGDNQTIFIRFNIPKDQKAGTYEGTFRIYVIGIGYKDISVSFKVNNFVLPEQNEYKSKYGVDSDMLADMFGVRASRSTEEYKELYNFMKEYGINVGYVPTGAGYTGESDLAAYIAVLEEYYNDPKISAIQLLTPKQSAHYEYKKSGSLATKTYDITIVDEFDSEYEGETVYGMRSILKAIAQYCVTNNINLFEKLYFRLNDEPYKPEDAISSILSYNAVKNSIDYALSQVNFSGHTDIQESLTNIPILITVNPSKEIEDAYGSTVKAFDSGNKFVDSVTSKTAYYTDENGVKINDIAINYTYLKGFVPYYTFVIGTSADSKVGTILDDSDPTTHVWWYSMVRTPNPYPNYALNANGVINRSKTWAAYYYGVEGELYWAVNDWKERIFIPTDSWTEVTTKQSESEIWNGTCVYFGCVEDGTLVYPNVTRYSGDFRYCATYRLVTTKEGIDDYNYICYAQSLIDRMESGSTKDAMQTLLDGYVAEMVNTSAPRAVVNSSKTNLQTQRGHVAKLIEDLQGYVLSDLEDLDSKVLVLSDVHIYDNADRQTQLKDALEYARDNNVSAVVFNGDTVEKGLQANYDILDGIFTEVFGSPSAEGIPEFVFNMGNHEFYLENDADYTYSTQFNLYKAFAEKWSRNTISDNVYAREIDGVYYVVAIPSDDEPGDNHKASWGYYTESDISKIGAIFVEILSDGTYDKPIILMTHWLLGKTYGGDYDALSGSYLTRFTTLLANYPQVVHLTGHTHFSSLHQRALEQDDYTTINIGQFANGWFVSGLETDENDATLTYDNVTGYRFNDDDPVSARLDANTYFGLLFGFTDDGLIVNRYNFAEDRISQRGWTIPYGITESNKSSKFYYEDSERSSETMHFAGDTALTGIINSSGVLKAITFKDVLEYRDCEGYKIEIKNGSGTLLKTVYWMSRFWADLGYRSEYYVPVSGLSHTGTYKIAIYAIDHFGNYSSQYSSASFVTDTYADKLMFAAGSDFDYTTTLNSYSTLTFDYKITDGNKFNLAITGDSMSNYYGYLSFDRDGEKSDYAGVSCENKGDGWVGVTITFADVEEIRGSAPATLKRFFIRGAFTDADGYVCNITFS